MKDSRWIRSDTAASQSPSCNKERLMMFYGHGSSLESSSYFLSLSLEAPGTRLVTVTKLWCSDPGVKIFIASLTCSETYGRAEVIRQVICLSSSPDYLLDLNFCRKIIKFSGYNLESRAILPDPLNSPRVTLAIPRFILVLLSLSRKYCAAILTCKSCLFAINIRVDQSPECRHKPQDENKNWHITQTELRLQTCSANKQHQHYQDITYTTVYLAKFGGSDMFPIFPLVVPSEYNQSRINIIERIIVW